jgi:hypothetical protein
MKVFKNVTIIEINENLLVLNNNNQIHFHYVSSEGISKGLVIPVETIYLALVENLAIHSLNATITSASISNDTSFI